MPTSISTVLLVSAVTSAAFINDILALVLLSLALINEALRTWAAQENANA